MKRVTVKQSVYSDLEERARQKGMSITDYVASLAVLARSVGK